MSPRSRALPDRGGNREDKTGCEGHRRNRCLPDSMLSSPYIRAAQTAEIFAAVLEYPKQKIQKTELLLPGAEPLQLFRELSKDKDNSVVFVFGHAPHLDDLIATAVGSKHHITALKKAGVAML